MKEFEIIKAEKHEHTITGFFRGKGYAVYYGKKKVYETYCGYEFINETVLGFTLYGEPLTGLQVRYRFAEEYIEWAKKTLESYYNSPWWKRLFVSTSNLLKKK